MSLSTSALAASRYGQAGYAPTPDMVTAADFAGWPEAMQVDLVRRYGSGQPLMVLVGSGTAAAIATLSAGGRTVDLTEVPVGFERAARDVAVSEFLRWPNAAQIFYALANGTAGAVEIGPAGASLLVSVTRDASGAATDVAGVASAGLIQADAPVFSVAPGALPAGSFFALPPDEQFAYASRYSAGTPPTISLAGAGGSATAITLVSNGRPYTARVPGTEYPGFAAPVSGHASAVADFDAWPSVVRSAYLEAQQPGTAYPKALVFGSAIWSVAARGADAECVLIPAGFADMPGALDPTAFLRWPHPAQIAYLRANLAGPTGSVEIGTNPKMSAELRTSSPVLRLSSAATPATPPGDLVLDLFELWPEPDRAAYLESNGTGTPKSIDLVATADRPRTLIAAEADGRVATFLVPTRFGDTPAALSPAAFQSWPTALRELYATREFAAAPDSLPATTFFGWQPFFRERYVAMRLADGETALTVGSGSDTVLASRTGVGSRLLLSPPSSPPNLTIFAALPDADRSAYLEANGSGTPKTIEVSGPPRTLLHRDAAGAVAAAAFPATYPAANGTADVEAGTFLGWPVAFQSLYAKANLDAGQGYATIGSTASGVIRATPSGAGIAVTFPPSAFALDLFRLWPAADRIAYFATNATGTPPGLAIGSPPTLVTLGSDGAVETAAIPADILTAPSALDAVTFLQWQSPIQQRYLAQHLATDARSLAIGSGNASVLVTRSGDGGLTSLPNGPAPDLGVVNALSAADRTAFFEAAGTGTPKTIDVPQASRSSMVVGSDGTITGSTVIVPRTLLFRDAGGAVTTATFPANFPAATSSSNVAARAFLAWAPIFQAVFASSRLDAGQRYATIGTDSSETLRARVSGNGVAISVAPADFNLDLFRLWPAADRAAYFVANAVGTPPGFVSSAPSPARLVTIGADGSVVTAELPAGYATAPSDLAPTTFLQWPAAVQQRYVAERMPVGATSLTIGTGDGSLVARVDPGSIGLTFAPTGPVTDAAAFMALPAADRLAYLVANGSGTPKTIDVLPVTRSVTTTNSDGTVTVAASTTLRRLIYQGGDGAVTIANHPTDYPPAASTAGVSPTVFLSWPPVFQRQYAATHLDPGKNYATITTSGSSTLTATPSGLGVAISTTPANFDLAQFRDWPAADRTAYFAANAAGDPRAIDTIASTRQGRTLVTLSGSGGVVSTAFPAGYPTNGRPVYPSVFLGWSATFQQIYTAERARLGGPLIATGETSPRPDTLEVSTFTAWPVALQADFVRTFGGEAKSLLLGSSGSRSMVRLLADGDVTIAAAPAGFETAPASLAVSTFLQWPFEAKVFYIQTMGSGGKVVVGPSTATLDATVQTSRGEAYKIDYVSSAGLKDAEQPVLVAPPSGYSVDFVLRLSPDSLERYLNSQGTGTPKALNFAPQSATKVITLLVDGKTIPIRVPTGSYPGFETSSLASIHSGISEAEFRLWPAAVQAAYVEARYVTDRTIGTPYPKVLVFGGTLAAVVREAGAEVELGVAPTHIRNAGAPSLQTFLASPFPAQVAYLRQKSELIKPDYTAQFERNTQTITTGGTTYTVEQSDRPPYFQIETPAKFSPAGSGTYIQPASLNLSEFAYWPAAHRTAYLDQYGVGPSKAVIVPADATSGRPRTVLYLEGGTLAAKTFPTAFATSPTTLNPLVFQGFEPIFQWLYLRENASADAGAVVIGPSGDQIRVMAGATGTVSVLSPVTPLAVPVSRGQTLEIPYHNLPGSDVGNTGEPNKSVAETLFPTLGGTAGHTIVTKPPAVAAEFSKTKAELQPAVFNTWHTAFQLEWLRREMGSDASVTIGPASGKQINAFISASGTKVYIAENLTKQDIAKMTPADQGKLAAMSVFQGTSGIGAMLGLIGDGPSATTAKTQMQALVAAAKAKVNGDNGVPAADRKVFEDQFDLIRDGFDNMRIFSKDEIEKQIGQISERWDRVNAFGVNLFKINNRDPEPDIFYRPDKDQFTLSSTSSSANIGAAQVVIFNNYYYDSGDIVMVNTPNGPQQLKSYLEKIAPPITNPIYNPLTNFSAGTTTDLTSLFPNGLEIVGPASLLVDGRPIFYLRSFQTTWTSVTNRVVSVDSNAKIKSGYDVFMAQERQLLNLQNTRRNLANNRDASGVELTRNLDVPSLVYLFQLYTNLAGEAKIRIASEEIEQINAMLKLYSVMQTMINRTVGQFTGDNASKDEKSMLGGSSSGGFTHEENCARHMFNMTSQSAGAPHPMETLLGVSRPSMGQDFTGNLPLSKWQNYSTSIGDKVTLINQESQIKMNEINSMTKQKDRNFDLANNALSKMSEVLQKIASLN